MNNAKNCHYGLMLILFLMGTTTAWGVTRNSAVKADPPPVSGMVSVNIKGKVLAAPQCTINSGQIIDVNFGTAMTTRVDTKEYKQPINYHLLCEDNIPNNALKVAITGAGAPFDAQILGTGNKDLGISILYQDKKLPLGQYVNFNWPNPPKLDALLVKRPGTKLSGGPFETIATLVISYQ